MESHTVQSNESLSTIAAKYGVDWRQLAQANDIPVVKKKGKDWALIRPGQTITIPPPGPSTQSGKVEEKSPTNFAPPPKPKPKPTALEVQLQSEYDKNPMSGTVVVPDPPPPPPPPQIMQDKPPVVPGDEGLNFQEGQHTPWYQQAISDLDPVKVTSQLFKPGGVSDPGFQDYINTATLGAGPEAMGLGSLVKSLMGVQPRIPQPMPGTARDVGDNTVTNLPPRSLLDSKFLKVPGRAEPPFGSGPKPPVVIGKGGRFAKGEWLPGRNPNLKPYLGEKLEPPFTSDRPLAEILQEALQ